MTRPVRARAMRYHSPFPDRGQAGRQLRDSAVTDAQIAHPALAERTAHLASAASFTTLARAKELEASGRDIIHLEVGEPDFATPAHIVAAGARALRDGYTRYTPAPGIPGLRQAIADDTCQRDGIDVPPDRVLVAPGAKPIIFYTAMALMEPGAEAVIPDPTFPTYASTIELLGGRVVRVPLREENAFALDVEALAAAIGPRTRLLVLASPSNPTGGVMSHAQVQAIAELLRRHPQVWVLSDEIYSRIRYSGRHHSIAAEPGMLDRTIVLNGFSKTYAMTGWRLGWGILPPALVEPFTRLQINVASCANAAAQVAGIAALTGPQDCVDEMVAAFCRRRNLLVDGLNALPGVRCTLPEGAFYAFPRVTAERGEEALATRLLEDAGLALLPGTGFGPGGAGYLRLSYANSEANLRKALLRLHEALA